LPQLTIIKIKDYGPWTLTLGSDREHQLQILQARIYGEIQKQFSKKNCLAFMNRSDEIFVITNGLNLDDHITIQKILQESFKLNLFMYVGFADTPYEANLKAYEGKKSQVILNNEYNIYGFINGEKNQNVTLMHFDVENLTSISETKSPYEISSIMFKLYGSMSEFFLNKNGLSFFMGGDNFMVASGDNSKQIAKEFLEKIRIEQGITLNCGIGTGKNAREAAKLATQSLDKIREIRDSGKEKPEIFEMPCF